MSNKKARKFWRVVRPCGRNTIQLEVIFPNEDSLYYYAAVEGASPVYIEEIIFELNLTFNELEYNLSRIPVQVCAS